MNTRRTASSREPGRPTPEEMLARVRREVAFALAQGLTTPEQALVTVARLEQQLAAMELHMLRPGQPGP